jgi:hypothetical protein
MKRITIFLVFTILVQLATGRDALKTQNIILITLDGLRWQEVFKGTDSLLLYDKQYVKDIPAIETKYWNSNSQISREKLMPFLWNTVEENGQIYGNRDIGSKVNLTNPYWFSYPGYNEILTGFADEKINSNSFGPNPNITVLEFVNQQESFQGRVAAFTSWGTFNDIINEDRSGVLVNAAFEELDIEKDNQRIDMLNKVQTLLPDLFYGIRLDGVTFQLAFEYLKEETPRFLFIGLDETDDFGHHGSYDYYLNSAHYADQMIAELWQWIQSEPGYKNQTTLLITCDHGRGTSEEWKDHGVKAEGSDQTWFAVIGPDTPAKGEIQSGQFYNNQFAKTLAAFLGFDYQTNEQPGDIIRQVFEE